VGEEQSTDLASQDEAFPTKPTRIEQLNPSKTGLLPKLSEGGGPDSDFPSRTGLRSRINYFAPAHRISQFPCRRSSLLLLLFFYIFL
jgi:hypothetical protein